jgi:hypothetical protein
MWRGREQWRGNGPFQHARGEKSRRHAQLRWVGGVIGAAAAIV